MFLSRVPDVLKLLHLGEASVGASMSAILAYMADTCVQRRLGFDI
jgi:hypothetical protein